MSSVTRAPPKLVSFAPLSIQPLSPVLPSFPFHSSSYLSFFLSFLFFPSLFLSFPSLISILSVSLSSYSPPSFFSCPLYFLVFDFFYSVVTPFFPSLFPVFLVLSLLFP